MVNGEYDDIKETFKHCYDIVSQVVSENGIDVYGTDLRVQTAASLTQAYFMNKLSKTFMLLITTDILDRHKVDYE